MHYGIQNSHSHHSSGAKAATEYLGKYHESSAVMVYDRWWNFFFDMVRTSLMKFYCYKLIG